MKLVKEYINEKFTEEDSDPLHDLNIGLIKEINLWIEKHKNYFKCSRQLNDYLKRGFTLPREYIKIDNNLHINVDGWVDMSILKEQIPDYIKFNHVTDDFVVCLNLEKYNHLNFFPKKVGGQIRIYTRYNDDINKKIENNIRNICNIGYNIDIIFRTS